MNSASSRLAIVAALIAAVSGVSPAVSASPIDPEGRYARRYMAITCPANAVSDAADLQGAWLSYGKNSIEYGTPVTATYRRVAKSTARRLCKAADA